jgi:hypothetical protein
LATIDAMCLKVIEDGDILGVVALVARKGELYITRPLGLQMQKQNESFEKTIFSD